MRFPIFYAWRESHMAHITKTASGWRAQVARKGQRKSATFDTKAAAQAWAVATESDILREARAPFPSKTLADAIDRYIDEVSVKKRGRRPEVMRLEAFRRSFPHLCAKLLHSITPTDIAAWRDARRLQVSDASVVREANNLRHIWTVAADWGWCGESPWAKTKLPRPAPARTRQTSASEIKRIVRNLGYRTGEIPHTVQQQVAYAYLVAHHTALRAGEILSLGRATVDLQRRVLRLEQHKTVERAGVRLVPFTRKAARLLRLLDGWAQDECREKYFTLSAASLDVLFRKIRDRLLIDGLTFHDARAAALTRLSRRLDVLRLAKISGHSDLRQLLNTYYRETAADVAAAI